MAIFKGRVRVRYGYSRWGYTRNNGKGWHGGSDEEGLDSTTIRMPDYKGKSISGRVVTARKVDRSTGSKTWEWGWYVCVELDAGQTPDAVNCLYFCHNARNLVSVGQRVKSGDALAVMGSTGNAALASPPFAHCHFEVRATATGKGLDPTVYAGCPNEVGTYGDQPAQTSGEEVLIDVSHHQGAIDWASVPYRAIVRIGYRDYGRGKLMKDEQYDANLAGAKANAKLFGFYFFSQAITVDEAREEADFCASLAPTGYPLFFDSEWGHTTDAGIHDGRADNLTKDQRTAIAMAFCDKAKAHGFTAGVYTFTSFASANIDYAYLCEDYIGWLGNNFDPSISWKDLEWIRDFWDGPMVIKGILDPEDARDAVRFGADGIVVSNHGGRQLDGVLSSARALPAIADAVKGDIAILADSGIRNGLDVVRMIALGADTVLLGRAFLYALATAGQAGVANLLNLIEKEMKVAMTLTGAKSISEITQDSLVQGLGKELPAALAPMAKGNAA